MPRTELFGFLGYLGSKLNLLLSWAFHRAVRAVVKRPWVLTSLGMLASARPHFMGFLNLLQWTP